MNRLQKLINELCPNGVEYKKIGDVLNYEQPSKFIVKNTNYNNNFKTPVLTAGQTFILGYTNENNNIYIASKDNPVIIFDDFTGAFKWVDFPFKVKSSAMKILTAKSDILIRYAYHVMAKINFSSDEHKRLWIGIYSKFFIPLPPIEIQQEIVRILDEYSTSVTALQQELEKELTARKKQYEYYRDMLLDFGVCSQAVNVEREREREREREWERLNCWQRECEWRTLGEIAEIGTGSSNTNEATDGGIYPFFVRSQEPLKKDTFEYDETAIITAGDGVGVGKVFHYIEGKYALHQRAYRIHITSNNVLSKFFFHYMRSNFYEYVTKTSFHSSVTSIRRPMLNEYPVPIPPLPEQHRIVAILDRFDKLCNDISEGLPAEIEARKKQYEYYRDKLLSFEELKK